MADSPHFFKIILNDAIRDAKLEIPKKFISQYGNGLSSPVTLNVPSGATWQVELLNRDNEVWLAKGWREFAKYHSLGHGHFLVFRYEQPCHFHVIIFNKSASEIEYPCSTVDPANLNLDEESEEPKSKDNEDHDSIEILDYPSPKGGVESLSPSHKKLRTRSIPINKAVDTAELKTSVKASAHSSRNTSRALEAANKYISEYPFFKSVVHVKGSSYVHIPSSFSNEHFPEKLYTVTVRVGDGDRSWPVRLLKYGEHKALFSAGWSTFAKENSLKDGDVCVFELIESAVFNVCIFRFDN